MKDFQHTLVYSIVLGVVCAAALTATSRLTNERYEENKKEFKAKEVMKVLGITDVAEYKKVKGPDPERKSGKIPSYTYTHPTEGVLTAYEFEGSGMWGPIKGLLCLKEDKKTIYAVSFYEQEETPGLGGDISTADFQDRFRGKRIVSATNVPGVYIKKGGGAVGPNEIDAITGATTTCKKVEDMLNKLIEELNKDGE